MSFEPINITATADLQDAISQLTSFGQSLTDLQGSSSSAQQAVSGLSGPASDSSSAMADLSNNSNQATTAVQQTGEAASTASKNTQGLGETIKGLVTGVAGFAGGIIGLVHSFTSLEKSQLGVERGQKSLTAAQAGVISATLAQQKALDKYGADSPQYEKATLNLSKAHQGLAIAEQNVKLKQDAFNEALANFATNIVPQIVSLGSGLAGIVSTIQGFGDKGAPALEKMGTAAKGASGGVQGLGTSLKAIALNPLTIALAAISIVLTAIATNFLGFRDALNAAGVAIGNAIPQLKPFLNLIQGVGAMFHLTGNDVKDAKGQINTSLKEMQQGFTDWLNSIKPIIDHFKTAFIAGLDYVKNGMLTFIDQLKSGDLAGAFNTAVEGIKGALQGIGKEVNYTFHDLFRPAVDAAVKKIKEISPALAPIAEDFRGFTIAADLALRGNFPKAIEVAIHNIQSLATDLKTFIEGPLKEFVDQLGANIIKGITGLVKQLPAAWKTLSDWITTAAKILGEQVGPAIVSGLTTLGDLLKPVIQTGINVVTDLFTTGGKGAATNWVNAVWTEIMKLPETIRKIFPEMTKAFDELVVTIQDVFKPVGDWFNTNVIKPIIGFFDTIPDGIKDLGGKIWTAIVNGIKTAAGTVAALIQEKIGTLPDFAKTGQDIWNAIVKGIQAAVGTVAALIQGKLGTLPDFTKVGQDIWDAIGKAITGAAGTIGDLINGKIGIFPDLTAPAKTMWSGVTTTLTTASTAWSTCVQNAEI